MRVKLFNKKTKKYKDTFFNIDCKGNPFVIWASGDKLAAESLGKEYEVHYYPGKNDTVKK